MLLSIEWSRRINSLIIGKNMDITDIVSVYEIPEYQKVKQGIIDSLNEAGATRLRGGPEPFSDVYITNYFGWENWPYDDRVHNVIKAFLEDYAKDGWCSKFEGHMWHQVYEKGDYHGWHVHVGNNMAAVVNVQCEENQGTLFRIGEYVYQYPSVEGTIIYFPAGILHRTPIHESDTPRIIMSINWDNKWEDSK
jgi:hypothetical protein